MGLLIGPSLNFYPLELTPPKTIKQPPLGWHAHIPQMIFSPFSGWTDGEIQHPAQLLSPGRNLERNPSSGQGKHEFGLAKPGGFFLPTFLRSPYPHPLEPMSCLGNSKTPLPYCLQPARAYQRDSGTLAWPSVTALESMRCGALAAGSQPTLTALPSAFPGQGSLWEGLVVLREGAHPRPLAPDP